MNKKLEKSLQNLSSHYACNEYKAVMAMHNSFAMQRADIHKIKTMAAEYIMTMRGSMDAIGIEAFFQQYGLDTDEGIAILSLAESLLRIPDSTTANALIHDKLQQANWAKTGDRSSSYWMRLSAFGMKLASRLAEKDDIRSLLTDPIVRRSIKQSMRFLGNHFVMGQTIDHAMHRAEASEKQGYTLSYDMLGEGARSDKQAAAYMQKYLDTLEAVGSTVNLQQELYKRPGISVKLSALHPHYSLANREEVLVHLVLRLKEILTRAEHFGVPVTIDAEESSRLDLSLEIFTQIVTDESFKAFEGIGLAVQAYHRHADKVIDYIGQLGQQVQRRIPVRLVKGAYWDAQIKQAQMLGLPDYPVFTHKSHTDIAYLACAYAMLGEEYIYPQFATHNAMTIAEIELAAAGKPFEFQRLHGMGKGIHDQLVGRHNCRIYAPVGEHQELLPYLIRRLLENSANSSFVKKLADPSIPPEKIATDPTADIIFDSPLPRPLDIYSDRKNSSGIELGNRHQLAQLQKELEKYRGKNWTASSIISGSHIGGGHKTTSPFDPEQAVGKVVQAGSDEIRAALDTTAAAFDRWSSTPVDKRAAILEKMADLLEKHRSEAMALCIQEAGKTIVDALAEVREAADFCRYYATQARTLLAGQPLEGPTGEANWLQMYGRGVFMCISPWNFPLAIFTGQIAAALVAGNCVIAKPAEQTPLIAAFAVRLWLEAGLPEAVIALLPGSGEMIGKHVLSDMRIAGVAFTGSMETAQIINLTLAKRGGPIIPFIAETGGQNTMIVDSSALIEQTVDDILLSAFGSAGQRCSALRVLYVQDTIADELLELLAGAMQELKLGNPQLPQTDLGPVIDRESYDKLKSYIKQMTNEGRLLARLESGKEPQSKGYFVEPHVFEIGAISDLPGEIFGPVLHVIRYKAKELDKVIAGINRVGFGLTLGIQSRISSRAEYIQSRVRVGNVYVNRSMTGATVGVQPFGGEGLSGTGPKAGGPHYLQRFVTERVVTVNLTAIGGNRELLV